MNVQDLLFVGFNSRLAALDQQTGDIVWQWKAPDGTGYVSPLLDGGKLFVSVNGYTYCLDAATGQQLWQNKMKGFGYGTTALVSVNGSTPHSLLGQAAAEAAQAAAAAGAGAGS